MDDDTAKQHAPLRINAELARSLEAVAQEEVSGEAARRTLAELLQAALRLEFAIIPVYLSAAFSLGAGNRKIAELLTRVAIEEMLHFIVVANTMNAIGVAPDIEAAIPTYPCDIPVIDPPLHLELRSFSFDLIRDTFLRVETPEDPIVFERALVARAKTVGEFYQGIIDIIEADTIPGLFDVDPANRNAAIVPGPPASFRRIDYLRDGEQGEYPLPSTIDFRIADTASAVRHLKWLVDQGEGTSRTDQDPIDLSGLPAHYYRFMSILKGRYLVQDSNAPNGHSYSGGSLPFDPASVHDSDANPKVVDFAAHPDVFRSMNVFNRSYSRMIDNLTAAFGSRDEAAASAAYQLSIGSMRSMPAHASAIYRAASRAGVKAGASFEYKPA